MSFEGRLARGDTCQGVGKVKGSEVTQAFETSNDVSDVGEIIQDIGGKVNNEIKK